MQLIISESPAPLERRSLKGSTSSSSTKTNPALHLNKDFVDNDKPASPLEYLRSVFPEDHRRNPYFRQQGASRSCFDDEDYNHEAARAIRSNDVAALRKLLDDGAEFDGRNRNGESLLNLACRRADVETVRFLVDEARVPIDCRDGLGRTALHDACWRPTPTFDLVDLFVSNADPKLLLAEDARGHTPFDYARRGDWSEWTAYLATKREQIELRIALSS